MRERKAETFGVVSVAAPIFCATFSFELEDECNFPAFCVEDASFEVGIEVVSGVPLVPFLWIVGVPAVVVALTFADQVEAAELWGVTGFVICFFSGEAVLDVVECARGTKKGSAGGGRGTRRHRRGPLLRRILGRTFFLRDRARSF